MSLVPVPTTYTAGTLQLPQQDRRNAWIDLMTPAADLANQIAQTDFVPAEFKNKPAAIAACILFGAELGIGPMVSLSKIDIVKGRPAPRAELGRALANAAGHELWIEETTNTRVTISGRRKGSQHVHTVTWTMDDAKKAGLAGNPNYAKYPRQMLLARASAELVRAMCPEVLGGITVFAEEAADIDDAPVTATATPADAPKTNTRKRRTPAPEPTTEAEPDDDAHPSKAQTSMAMAEFTEAGITDRDERLGITGALLGRTVESWNDLTRAEASTVIDGLGRIKAGQIALTVLADGTWRAEAIDDGADPTLPDDTLDLDPDAGA